MISPILLRALREGFDDLICYFGDCSEYRIATFVHSLCRIALFEATSIEPSQSPLLSRWFIAKINLLYWCRCGSASIQFPLFLHL
jgi:hypothetical protein